MVLLICNIISKVAALLCNNGKNPNTSIERIQNKFAT